MTEIIVIGLIQTGWLLWKINYLKRIKNYKGRVIAKVIDVKEHGFPERRWGKVHTYYPTYQYSVNGIVYEKRSLWGYYDKLCYPLEVRLLCIMMKKSLRDRQWAEEWKRNFGRRIYGM